MITRKMQATVGGALAEFPAVALLGPRQVGKTTLAHEIATNQPQAVTLDLELPADIARLADPGGFLAAQKGRLVVLDEIQRMPNLFEVLRAVIDARRRQGERVGQFLLLGSASRELLAQSSESLAGRIVYLELTPLLVEEIEYAQLDALWIRGGFPESFLAADRTRSYAWREAFIRTFLEREIHAFAPRLASTTLRRLWVMLAHDQGGLLNSSRLAASLGVSATSVTRYVDLLCNLMLVRRLQPYFTNIGKRMTRAPKVYVRDSGITHTLLGLLDLDSVLSHPVAGGSWEGFVIEQLIAAAPAGTQPWFYRTAAGAEIDLVLDIPGNGLYAFEIKRSTAPTIGKGFYSACDDIKATQSRVVYPGTDRYPVKNQTIVVPVAEAVRELRGLAAL